jgi:hypothetical protein
VNLETWKKFLRSLVWSTALYGCETWNVSTEEKKRLESFEMWCYRRILKIKWTDYITNEEVLARMNCKRSLWYYIVRKRVTMVGHILRHEGLMKTVLEGRVEGKNYRGRPRLEYIEQIIKEVGCKTYSEMKRTGWRAASYQPKG